jgi:hypothetical protein
VAGLVANATGISKASVCRVRKELKTDGKLVTTKDNREIKPVK